MTRMNPDAFDSAVQKAHLWIKQVQQEARLVDRGSAYSALRAGLHALRDCLPADGVLKLGAHLPLLIKGVLFDGWKPRRSGRPTRQELLDRMAHELRGCREVDAALAVRAVTRTLAAHAGRAQMETLLFQAPRHTRALFREALGEEEGPGAPRRPGPMAAFPPRRLAGRATARGRAREAASLERGRRAPEGVQPAGRGVRGPDALH